jgi:hypothetical protein
VDPSRDTTHGPFRIQTNGTVTMPKPLMQEVGLDIGRHVHWLLNPDIPGTLVVVPDEMMARVQPDILAALRKVAK